MGTTITTHILLCLPPFPRPSLFPHPQAYIDVNLKAEFESKYWYVRQGGEGERKEATVSGYTP